MKQNKINIKYLTLTCSAVFSASVFISKPVTLISFCKLIFSKPLNN